MGPQRIQRGPPQSHRLHLNGSVADTRSHFLRPELPDTNQSTSMPFPVAKAYIGPERQGLSASDPHPVVNARQLQSPDLAKDGPPTYRRPYPEGRPIGEPQSTRGTADDVMEVRTPLKARRSPNFGTTYSGKHIQPPMNGSTQEIAGTDPPEPAATEVLRSLDDRRCPETEEQPVPTTYHARRGSRRKAKEILADAHPSPYQYQHPPAETPAVQRPANRQTPNHEPE